MTTCATHGSKPKITCDFAIEGHGKNLFQGSQVHPKILAILIDRKLQKNNFVEILPKNRITRFLSYREKGGDQKCWCQIDKPSREIRMKIPEKFLTKSGNLRKAGLINSQFDLFLDDLKRHDPVNQFGLHTTTSQAPSKTPAGILNDSSINPTSDLGKIEPTTEYLILKKNETFEIKSESLVTETSEISTHDFLYSTEPGNSSNHDEKTTRIKPIYKNNKFPVITEKNQTTETPIKTNHPRIIRNKPKIQPTSEVGQDRLFPWYPNFANPEPIRRTRPFINENLNPPRKPKLIKKNPTDESNSGMYFIKIEY